jgi:hypothetical protein
MQSAVQSIFLYMVSVTIPRSASAAHALPWHSRRATLPLSPVLWRYRAQTMRGNKSSRTKIRIQNKGQQKALYSTVDFSKDDPLYKCRSSPFYREANRLFTFREYPRVKRIKTECARLSLGNLQLGLHVIGASWCRAANRGAFLVVITCACREKTFNLLETPLSPGTFRHLKHGSHSNLKSLDVRDDETPQVNPRPRLTGWARFVSGVSSWESQTAWPRP